MTSVSSGIQQRVTASAGADHGREVLPPISHGVCYLGFAVRRNFQRKIDGLRISFHVYNTVDDVHAVVEILKKNINLMVLAPAVASHD